MNLEFHPKFIFRTPTLTYDFAARDEDDIAAVAKTEQFQEAIYLASPELQATTLRTPLAFVLSF